MMDWPRIGFTVCLAVLTGRVLFRRYDMGWNIGVATWVILELMGVWQKIGL